VELPAWTGHATCKYRNNGPLRRTPPFRKAAYGMPSTLSWLTPGVRKL